MANTVIALKKSGTPSATPSSLANGELAINYADGKLFYKAANGTILAISGSGGSGGGSSNSFSTINANGTLVVADSSNNILTIIPGNNITIVGDAINDKITIGLSDEVVIPGTLYLKAVGGDEGGQIELANAVTNSVLAGNVVVDVYQNKLRFYEKDSPNKGAFINLAATTTSVGTDLLAGSSGTDTIARAAASAAFDKANSANVLAYNTGISSNAYATTVGTAGNTYLLATLAGANSAVGTGANAYAASIGTAGNTYLLATLSGANTAVGTGANNYLLAVIAGANTAVGTGANTVGIAAFAAENITRAIAVAAYGNSNTKFSSSGGTINGDVQISGNLSVTGNTIWTNVSSFIVNDPLIYLAGNNYVSDIVDIGFVANYVNATGANVHTGVFRDAGNKEYYVFQEYNQEPYNNVIDPTANGFQIAILNATLRTSNIILGGINALSWITNAYNAANNANVVAIANVNYVNTAMQAAFAQVNVAIANVNFVNTAMQAAFAQANTIGGSSNTYLLSVIAGANAAVGAGANTVGAAAFARANSSNAQIIIDSVSADRYLIMNDTTTGTLDKANVGLGLTYNPSSNQMTLTHGTNGPRITLKQTGTSGLPSYLIFSRTTGTTGSFHGTISWSTTASDLTNTMTSTIQAFGSPVMPSQNQSLIYSAFTDHRFQVATGNGNTQFANASVEVVRINNSGNVGIGTISPTSKLHVVGDANITNSLVVLGNTSAPNNNYGAVVVRGGIGVTGNVYTANAIGWANATTNVSAVYTFYNSVTNSLDTVFG